MTTPHAVVTGGTGFLMAHVARAWLEAQPNGHVTLVGRAGPEPQVIAWLADTADRATFLAGDVRRPADWGPKISGPVDVVVHGAALCPLGAEEEAARWAETVDVNVMGTVALLDWVAQLNPVPRRVIYVSSGVYGYGTDAAPNTPPAPAIAEDAPLLPQDATYDITKAAGEWLTARWGAITGIDTCAVRPSAIFGPLDRDTDGRTRHPAPWHMARAAMAGRHLTVNDPDAGYDWLYAPDASRAIGAIMTATAPRHPVYNIGYGRPTRLAELAEGVRRVVPEFALTPSPTPEFVQPTDRRGGVWSVRDTSRLEAEFDWRPTPLPDAMALYLRWLLGPGMSPRVDR
ncbi:MAG: NAD(P)-dependent oxidoreductase [Pseudomonadota bacterium]